LSASTVRTTVHGTSVPPRSPGVEPERANHDWRHQVGEHQ
jgi:hypothetical protein